MNHTTFSSSPRLSRIGSPAPAETPMPFAPSVTLENGYRFTPQHYLRYNQTLESLQVILMDIQYDPSVLLFASEDNSGLYLQIGLIGRENYDRTASLRPNKLVYGRKWRIDQDTPTSEIVQTAMLAIQKAREHEIRELLTLTDKTTGKTSTPLSNHLDIHLLKEHGTQLTQASPALTQSNEVTQALSVIRFAERKVRLQNMEQRSNQTWILDLALATPPLARYLENDLPEYTNLAFSLIVSELTSSRLFYSLMDALIQHSNQHVEEHFTYQGFKRFSRMLNPEHIASLSISSRPYARDAKNARFMSIFQASNYEVDAGRAPDIGTGPLAKEISDRIRTIPHLQGHMPRGFSFL